MKNRLSATEIELLKKFATDRVIETEKIWQKVAPDIVELAEDHSITKFAKAMTQIPGYEEIEKDINVVDNFVVLMADMRNSTKHLTEACSGVYKEATGLKRLFIETSVLLPCMAKIISFGNGKTLEYLGDGILAVYRVTPGSESGVIGDAQRSAEKIVECVTQIISPILKKDYNLPPISVGVGIAKSQGIVRMVGIEGFLVPKVFGKSVFYASKLCCGDNEIYLDSMARAMWPVAKHGETVYVDFKKVVTQNGGKMYEGYQVHYR